MLVLTITLAGCIIIMLDLDLDRYLSRQLWA